MRPVARAAALAVAVLATATARAAAPARDEVAAAPAPASELVAAAPAPASEKVAAPAPASEDAAAAPVHFRDETPFHVRTPLGFPSLEARARAVERRLRAAADGPSQALGSVRFEEHAGASTVYAGDTLIIAVTDADAAPVGRTRQQLAADNVEIVRRLLAREFHDRSLRGVIVATSITLVSSLLLVLVLVSVSAGRRRLLPRIETGSRSLAARLARRHIGYLSPASIAALLGGALGAMRWLIVLLVLGIYVSVVLGLFPWTRGAANQIFTQLREALGWMGSGLLAYLPKLLYLALITLVARFAMRLARLVFQELARGSFTIRGFHADWAEPTYQIVRFLLFVLAAIVAFPYLPGSGSVAFQGISVFLGVVFSLGSGSAIANIISGLVITYMRPFSVGDRVQIGDTIGDVVSKNLLVVRICSIKNVETTVPNSLVLSSHVVNYSARARAGGLILHTTVTIGYDAPWRQVHELLIAAAAATEGTLAEPAPFVLQTGLDDFYVRYEINVYTDRPNDMAVVSSRLNQNIQDRFQAAGVEIMSPHYSAVRDGNTVTIPAEKLPPGYRAPRFRVAVDRSGEPEK